MNIIKWLFQAAKSGGNLLQSNSNWNSDEPDKHVACLMLHAQPLRLLHERPLLALVQQSGGGAGRKREGLS